MTITTDHNTTAAEPIHIRLVSNNTAIAIYQGREVLMDQELKTNSKKRNQKDAVPVLCRALIAGGADSKKLTHITRDGTSVWQKDKTLGEWAALDIVDREIGGLVIITFVPMPEAALLAVKAA